MNHIWKALVWLCLASCAVKENKEGMDLKMPQYATKFAFTPSGVAVLEPWPGAVKPKVYPIDKPLNRIVATSTTHLPYLEMLGVGDRLVGFPGTKYISSPYFRERVASGAITDLGPDGNLNMELLYSLEPDAIIAFDMGSESALLGKLQESGITVFYNSDFLESSALGRAEWIRFFGTLFKVPAQADQVFDSIALQYLSLKELTRDVPYRPTVLSGIMYGDAWFMPGGKNWSAEFFRDAGGQYLWEENNASGWLELSFEAVFEKAGKAEYWIGVATVNSRKELEAQDSRYAAFDAFANQKIYNYNKRRNPTGGYDFFESAYARPDMVLADLIHILHPELLPDHETYYFQQVP